jgi:hypothetical protein
MDLQKLMINQWFEINLVRDKFVESFIRLNKDLVKNLRSSAKQNNRIVLMECNISFVGYLLYSIICQIQIQKGFKIVAYNPLSLPRIKDNLSFKIFTKVFMDNGIYRPFRILNSMGVSSFIKPKKSRRFLADALIVYAKVVKNDKYFLLNLELDGIRLGDLFYDWHLRLRLLDTVNVKSEDFKSDFLHFLKDFYWWQSYFKKNQIECIFVSHSIQQFGLLGRIGLKYGSKVYLASGNRIYKISAQNIWADTEFLTYDPKSKIQFDYTIDLVRAHSKINDLKQGVLVSDAYAYGSGFIGGLNETLVKNKNAINVLIACHCFSDGPHSNGDMLFPDFREWLNHIGELSKTNPYDFYAKPHPNFWESDHRLFQNFLQHYPNIQEIPKNVSNLNLFKQGINVVLTAYGTIAFEAAYEGILVVNASRNAPHVNYNFSLTPESINEFSQIINELPAMLEKWRIDKNEVAHFFDLHHLRNNSHLLFGAETQSFYEFIGGYKEQFTNPKVFEYWLNKVNYLQLQEIKLTISKFFNDDKILFLKSVT